MASEFPEKSKSELMADILTAIDFHVMKIVRVDLRNKLLFEDLVLDRTSGGITQVAFSFSALEKVIQLLCDTKNTVSLSAPLTTIGQVAYKKINMRFAVEAFVPLFTDKSKIDGLIYLARQSGEAEFPRSEAYMSSMRLLVLLVEREFYQQAIQDKLNKTVLMFCEIINAKEPMMISNSYAVMLWSVRIARQMRLPETEIQKLQLAALMHNLGKIYLDEHILAHDDENTLINQEAARQRTERSHELALRLGRIYELDDIPEIILRFQERVDGTGYPGRLSGDQIPLLSRILCVAKAIAAMFSTKSNRKAMTLDEIVREVKTNAGTQFDVHVAAAALALLIDKRYENADFFSGMGSYATLSITVGGQSDSTIQLFGQVRKISNLHVFNPMDKMPSIDPQRISSCALYMDVNGRIIQFDVDIRQFLPDRILLNRVEPRRGEEMFSVLWYMDGTLITSDRVIHSIYISVLGGDYMDFYILGDQSPAAFTSGIVKVALKDQVDTFLPGIVAFRQPMNGKTFYIFKYTNVTEADRQAVFSAMFRKQMEMRASIARTVLKTQSKGQEAPGTGGLGGTGPSVRMPRNVARSDFV